MTRHPLNYYVTIFAWYQLSSHLGRKDVALIQQNISKLFGLGSTVQFLNGRGSDGWVECCGGGGGDGPDQNKLQKKTEKASGGRWLGTFLWVKDL